MDLKGSNTRKLFVIAAIAIAAILTGMLAFGAAHDYFAAWETRAGYSPFSIVPTGTPTVGPVIRSTLDPLAPIQPADYPPGKPWDEKSRINILLIGLDARDGDLFDGPPRADTLILMTIDPETNTAGMLSIPRDLWVNIPGHDYGKINTAYQIGELEQVAGRGPGLTMTTIETLMGITIDYYAQVDFQAFVTIIDEMGGVKLFIPEEIGIDLQGKGDAKVLFPGVQTLPGEVALAYARARNTEGGDFDRAKRQQAVLLALRERIVNFDLLPTLIAKAPILYQELSNRINTNLSLDQIIKVAIISTQIPEHQITRTAIGTGEVSFAKSPEGLDILKPIPDNIRILRDDFFSTNSPFTNAATTKSLNQLISEEAARIALLNGTQTIGLAAVTRDYLADFNLNILKTGNAASVHAHTTLIDYSGKPYTMQYLVETLNVLPQYIFNSFDPNNQIDIEVILGADWVASGVIP